MMLQKILQWSDHAVVSVVADEARPGESQEVFEARMVALLEKVFGMILTKPTNPSMYKDEDN
jgi:hypothetical protein